MDAACCEHEFGTFQAGSAQLLLHLCSFRAVGTVASSERQPGLGRGWAGACKRGQWTA